MRNRTKVQSRLPAAAGLLVVALLAGLPLDAQSQQVFNACYVPNVGTVYLIKQAGLPSACRSPMHVEFSWMATTQVADGSITTPKLADQAVTTTKLADGAVTMAKLAVTLMTQDILENTHTLTGGSGVTDIGQCPAGWIALSGGWLMTTGSVADLAVVESRAEGADGWRFTVYNTNPNNLLSIGVSLYIRCARLGT